MINIYWPARTHQKLFSLKTTALWKELLLIRLHGSKMISDSRYIFKWLFCQITTERLMVIFKIDPRCLPFFSDVLRKIMSAGTRWFCVRKRKAVTVNNPCVGFLSPHSQPPRWGGCNQNPQLLLSLRLCQTDVGGFIWVWIWKILHATVTLLIPYWNLISERELLVFWRIRPLPPEIPARGPSYPRWLSSRLSAGTKDIHTPASRFLLLPIFRLDVWLPVGF